METRTPVNVEETSEASRAPDEVIAASRHANSGLNWQTRTISSRSQLVEQVGTTQTTYPLKWTTGEDEDMAELEELMAPKDMKSTIESCGWHTVNQVKGSRYTTGILTVSGWEPITATHWDGTNVASSAYVVGFDEHRGEVRTSPETTKNVETGNVRSLDRDSEIRDIEGHRDDENSTKETITANRTIKKSRKKKDPVGVAVPPMDEKWFDYDGYLVYLKAQEKRPKSIRIPKAALKGKGKPDEQETPKVWPPNLNNDVVVDEGTTDPAATIQNDVVARQGRKMHPKKKMTPTNGTDDVASPTTAEESQENFDRESPTTPFEAFDESREEQQASVISQTGKWELLSNTVLARIGVPEPERLMIYLRDTESQVDEALTFDKISHGDIDWNSNADVYEINQWRNRVFRDHPFNIRAEKVKYAPEQIDWLLLFHKKIKAAAETGAIFKLPGVVPVTKAMNQFFEGKVFTDVYRQPLPQRELRDETSVRGKIQKKGSEIWTLRDEARRLLEGKQGGKLYVPSITDEELLQYRARGIVVTDDPNDDLKNAAKGKSRRESTKWKRAVKEDSDEQDLNRAKPEDVQSSTVHFSDADDSASSIEDELMRLQATSDEVPDGGQVGEGQIMGGQDIDMSTV